MTSFSEHFLDRCGLMLCHLFMKILEMLEFFQKVCLLYVYTYKNQAHGINTIYKMSIFTIAFGKYLLALQKVKSVSLARILAKDNFLQMKNNKIEDIDIDMNHIEDSSKSKEVKYLAIKIYWEFPPFITKASPTI